MKNGFVDKAKKKLKKVGRQLVPYNGHYKPLGTYASAADFVASGISPQARYHLLYPSLVSKLPVPRSMFASLASYAIYDKVADEGDTPVLHNTEDYGMVEIPDGRLFSDNELTVAVISTDNKLIGDMSYQHIGGGKKASPQQNTLFQQRYFKDPTHYKGTVFNMLSGGGGVSNYYHWVIDVLPRVHLLQQAGLFHEVDWFVVPNGKISFQKETLALLGIPEEKIIEANEQFHIQADRLLASSHPRGEKSNLLPEWLIQFYRRTFLDIPSGKKFGPLVYVSRRDSSFRQITNEDALIKLLKSYGFESYELSKLTFLEKKDLFASAKVVVSASGAGLSNLLFSGAGGSLVEFFPKGFVNTHYYNIAYAVGMEYHFLLSEGEVKATSAKEGQLENLTINLSQMDQLLQKIISEQHATLRS